MCLIKSISAVTNYNSSSCYSRFTALSKKYVKCKCSFHRLEDEAKILKSLSHPNIIGFRGFNKKEDGTHALVMEDGHKALMDMIEV